MRVLNTHTIRKERGDTIIEVLIALAVLGLAFSISYATATRSLLFARNAQEHSEALQYLNSQVELARADSADDSLYTQGQTLCMDTVTSDINYGKPIPATSVDCNAATLYNLSYTYDKAPANGINQDVFTFTVQWAGVGSLGPQQEQMSYKIHKLAAASGSTTSFMPTTPPPPPPPVPTANLTANPTTVPYGTATTLSWSSTNTTSCSINTIGTVNPPSGGSIGTGPLTASKTFTLSCTSPGGPASSSPVTVTVQPPPGPTVDCLVASTNFGFDCSSAIPTPTVFSGQRVYLYWSSSNANYCTATGPVFNKSFLPTSSISSGADPSQPLFFTPTTFTMTCTSSSTGVVSNPASVQVNVFGGSPCTAFAQSKGQC